MKKISNSEIEKIYLREIDFLVDGIENISNPFHYFTLSTINNNSSSIRTVVLRNLVLNPLSFYFNADYRSPKVKQLLKNKYCSILFFDFKRKIQIRVLCKPIVNHKNSVCKEVWSKTLLQSRKCYMGKYSPSQGLDKWHPNVPLKYLEKDPSKVDSELGYENFSVIKLVSRNLDILELHYDGHIRFNVDSSGMFKFIAP